MLRVDCAFPCVALIFPHAGIQISEWHGVPLCTNRRHPAAAAHGGREQATMYEQLWLMLSLLRVGVLFQPLKARLKLSATNTLGGFEFFDCHHLHQYMCQHRVWRLKIFLQRTVPIPPFFAIFFSSPAPIHAPPLLPRCLLPVFLFANFSQEHTVGFDDERDRGQKRRRLSPVKGQQGWEPHPLSTPAVPPTPARRSAPKPLPPNSSRYLRHST